MYQHVHAVDDDDDDGWCSDNEDCYHFDDDVDAANDDEDQLIVLIKVPAEDAGYGALEQAAVLDVEVKFWEKCDHGCSTSKYAFSTGAFSNDASTCAELMTNSFLIGWRNKRGVINPLALNSFQSF